MKYAIPACEGKLFNHYSKAPQFIVIDDTTMEKQCIDVIKPTTAPSKHSTCGNKSVIMSLLQANQVNAVIVKNIGESMLQALFNNKIEVFTIMRGADTENIDLNRLIPVEDLSFARPSTNKEKKGHTCCKNKHAHPLVKSSNRLSANALNKLQRIHNIHP